MRVALVQCPPWGSLPPLGLASLKAYVEEHSHDVKCFDVNIDYCRERLSDLLDDAGGSVYARPDPWSSGSYEEWAFDFDGEVRFKSALKERPLPIERWSDEILRYEPRIVGFSVQSTNLGVTLQVAQQIARRNPEILVVFGGPNVAELQEGAMALETGVPDVVVEGEGEATLVELIEAVENNRDLSAVAGIGLLVDGKPVWTERRPLLSGINDLPFPDFSDFDWSMYPNPYEIPIMTSRGCVLNCAFCYETVYWKRFRTQKAERIVAEMKYQIAQHPFRADVEAGKVRFGMSLADSLVNGHLGGLKRMAELLIESDTDIYWNGQATINAKMDDEFFRKLADSGCSGLSFGLESGSPRVLESMGKRFEIEEATEFFERVQRSGIELVVNIMVGFPTETRADFVETLAFLAKIRQMIFMVNNVGATSVMRGSRLHQTPEQFGVVPIDADGWATGANFEWRTDAAGNEKNRERRVKLLHMWMTFMRIPHQRIGPPPRWLKLIPRWPRAIPRRLIDGAPKWAPIVSGTVVDTLAVKVADRVRPIPRDVAACIGEHAASLGEDPLTLVVRDDAISRIVNSPVWSDPLVPSTWIGLPIDDFSDVIADKLGDGVTVSEVRMIDGTGHVEVHVLEPATPLIGLRALVFQLRASGDRQVIAIFPLPLEQPVVAGNRAQPVALSRRERSQN